MGNYNVSSFHYMSLAENLQRWVYVIVFISLDAEVIPQCQIELFDMQLLNISDKNNIKYQPVIWISISLRNFIV